VTFTPAAVGARNASVTVVDDAPGSPHTVTLTGTGTNSAIAFDKNLGTYHENIGSSTMTMTTTAPAAAHTRVFAFVTWNATGTITSVSGGGLTWTVDRQAQDSADNHGAIVSADAPAGLASGTVITATFSGLVGHGLIAAASFSGISPTSPPDGTNSSTQSGVATWSASVTTANANDLVIAWSAIDADTTSTPTAPSVEIHDFGDIDLYAWGTSAYRIASAAGTTTVGGTWGRSSGATANVTVIAAYRAG
jgi:hypothetical protein